jgi:predicted nucleotidyltransferase
MYNKEKLLKVLFQNPLTKFHVRELARLTKLNPNTIINISKEIKKENLIKIEKKKHLVEISANIKDDRFITKKRIHNLSCLYESNLVEFLKKEIEPELISVMGSYSRGEDIEKSDIDIVVISTNKQTPDLTKFEKTLNRQIHLLHIDYKEISDEFYINLINGIVLSGFVRKK